MISNYNEAELAHVMGKTVVLDNNLNTLMRFFFSLIFQGIGRHFLLTNVCTLGLCHHLSITHHYQFYRLPSLTQELPLMDRPKE